MANLRDELKKRFEESGLDKQLLPSEKEKIVQIVSDARKKHAKREFLDTTEHFPAYDKD